MPSSFKKFAAVLALFFAADCAYAQTWNGGGGANNKWSNNGILGIGGNWSGGVPANNGTAIVIFAGTTSLTPDMDSNYNINSLAFSSGAGAFMLGSTGNFTLTIQSSGITNSSTNTETISNAVNLGTAQTWNASSGNLTVDGDIANGGFLLTISGGSNTNASGVISGSGGLTKNGTGTLTLSGANTYSGVTTVSAGTLKIDNNNTTSARLVNTSGITVNSGGTLLLSQSGGTASADRINDSATMTLNGGTFNTAGLSEHGSSNNTAGIGALTLQSTSTIDLGNGSSIIAFANSHLASWSGTLNIYDWTGTLGQGGSTDQLYIGSDSTGLTASQLAEINFYSDAGTTFLGHAVILATGEIVPIPEPSTWATAALALLWIGFQWWRKRLRFQIRFPAR